MTDTQTDRQTPHDSIGHTYAQHLAAKIRDNSLTADRFPDISRFSRQVVTLYKPSNAYSESHTILL